MSVKFSEDIVPLTDMKVNPWKIVKRTNEYHRPVLLTGDSHALLQMVVYEDLILAEILFFVLILKFLNV